MNSTQKKPHRIARFLWRLFLTVFFLTALAGTSLIVYVIMTAPPLDEAAVAPHGYRTSVLDDAGNEILTLAGEESNRVYITLDEIPVHLQNAFIAIEDERFYSHRGIDLQGIARAFVRNLSTGSLSQGASTITQQLIKNNVFAAGANETTVLDKIKRKLQEQYLALRLEQTQSKSWILENYLNTINLGGGTWGVRTAAQRYFGKEVSDLTLAESAAIAAITRNPTVYNPLRNPEKNRERQHLVLSRMREQGMILSPEYQAALSEDIYTDMEETATGGEIPVFSWFEDAALSQVAEDLAQKEKISQHDAWQMLYHDGLTVMTTRDSVLQAICEEEINRDSGNGAQATAVMIDPVSGAVKAIVGGRGEKTASLTWNRAVSSPRQPGSTLKILGEYAAALESGSVTLATVYNDAPTSYSDGTPIRNSEGGYSGRTTVRRAIADSLNTVALRCFQQIGLQSVWTQLTLFNLRHLDHQDWVEALALGGTHGGVTNLELTAAYAALAHDGIYTEPYYYTRVLDRDGAVLLEHRTDAHRAVRAETAALLTSAMEDVLAYGTGTEAAFPGQALAGKSGTTTERRDLWFVGYSPSYACGVWTGYDDFSPQESSSPVKHIWKEIMRRAHENAPEQFFTFPESLTQARVCIKCGNLAVEGLCEETVQGNMTRTEQFAPGSAPSELCVCHVRAEICVESGELSGPYCEYHESRVFLREGTEGTADAAAVIPSQTCQLHLNWLDLLFPEDGEETESVPELPDEWNRPEDRRGEWDEREERRRNWWFPW